MPVPEAKMINRDGGLTPEGEGWFVVNVADARAETDATFGQWVRFENSETAKFPHYGVNIHVVQPGQASAMYHGESNQESFLILEGECILVVEGEERRLKKWDFFYAPPMTRHITVGAGDGPCAILMMGARLPDEVIEYPHDPLAAKYGAQAPVPTPDPEVAYSEVDKTVVPGPFTWPVSPV